MPGQLVVLALVVQLLQLIDFDVVGVLFDRFDELVVISCCIGWPRLDLVVVVEDLELLFE